MSAPDAVGQGWEAFDGHAWGDAYALLATADQQDGLGAAALERLAMAAHLTGHVEAAIDAWERAHDALLAQDEDSRAARCAFWISLALMQRGEHARAGGWLERARQVLADAGVERVEHGYLLVPAAQQALDAGDGEAAYETLQQIAAIADRFDDVDLAAFGQLGRGQALVAMGAVADGMALLDAAMVAVTAGSVSPIAAGIIYCTVIIVCQEVFDLRRAQEWTTALTRWCDSQQDLHPFRGQCLVHRSQIMQLRGEWNGAMAEAEQACAHLSASPTDPVLGMARYQQAELLRLRGAFTRAEEAYRQASRWGHEVHPGLALLRLAQGRTEDADAAIRRVADQAESPVERARVLVAYVEIVLAGADLDAARSATDELGQFAAHFNAPYLHAIHAFARGAVALAEGDARRAGVVLGRARTAWHQLDVPYEAARARLLMAQACHALGDHDTAEMELDAARRVFQELGAAPDLAQLETVSGRAAPRAPGGLTRREEEVLRHVADGATNRQIADALVISQKTVARHLSNTFAKLGVSSRVAATAWAYEHDLV